MLGPLVLPAPPAADPAHAALLPPGTAVTEIVVDDGRTLVSPSVRIDGDTGRRRRPATDGDRSRAIESPAIRETRFLARQRPIRPRCPDPAHGRRPDLHLHRRPGGPHRAAGRHDRRAHRRHRRPRGGCGPHAARGRPHGLPRALSADPPGHPLPTRTAGAGDRARDDLVDGSRAPGPRTGPDPARSHLRARGPGGGQLRR